MPTRWFTTGHTVRWFRPAHRHIASLVAASEKTSPLYAYRVPVADLTSVELFDRIPFYVGWGIRVWGDVLYFATQHKQSVLVHKKSGYFKKVVFSAREPMKLIAGIQAAQKMGHEKQAEEAK